MTQFFKVYLISMTLLGISACGSGDSKTPTYSTHIIHKQTIKIKAILARPQERICTILLFKNDLSTDKRLVAQSTVNLSTSSLSWDFDNDGNADALTDGLLLLRYAFGLRGSSLVQVRYLKTLRCLRHDLQSMIESSPGIADIDGDEQVDALTDGLILLRYLFGLRGDALIVGAISVDASRSSSGDITNYLISFMPSPVVEPTTITISGRVTFDQIPFDTNGYGLNYSGTFASPARAVVVEALDSSGNIVASNNTDADGNYSLVANKGLELRVRVSRRK